MNGIELITQERERQISKEGWTPSHDDSHTGCEMALAAICYAAPVELKAKVWTHDIPCGCRSVGECNHNVFARHEWRDPWPWDSEWDKRCKHDRLRQLAIAGALIAAEIDRLQRAEDIKV